MNRIRINKIVARSVWDSRARPTVEVDVLLDNGRFGRGIAPAGASRGSREATDLRDGGQTYGGFGVRKAVANVEQILAPRLLGMTLDDPRALDALIRDADSTPNKMRIGGNAATATSLALWQAAAVAQNCALWQLLANDSKPRLPLPQIQIFGGGAHAARRVDLQDFLVIPVGAYSFAEALDMVDAVYRTAGVIMSERGHLSGTADEGGWWPQFASNEDALTTLTLAIERSGLKPLEQVAIAIDVAASEFSRGNRYVLGLERRELSLDEWLTQLTDWIGRYPIVSVEDPCAEDDDAGWRAFGAKVANRIQVVGDDYLVTSAARVAAAAQSGSCNAVLLKVNQRGTVTEAEEALTAARRAGFATIVSARSGETEDTAIAHLAVGWNAGQIKVGSMARGERTAKWNELLRIEAAMGSGAALASRAVLGQQQLRQ